ncbi:hypothetical protein SNE40_020028 [Patella caerulea]|uniref:Uncharacterized protein n=1 Tax=Patella caerulea TaxID=87958 RepID=A0AAN8G6Q3_PATCE
MSDWGVALLAIVICAVAAIAIAILFRLFGIYHLAACFADDEEKMVLTKHEQGNGYMVNSDTQEYVLDTSGQFIQCDALVSEPKYSSLDTSTATVTKQQSHDDSARSSPVSIATSSIASELEYCHGIRRAESCESVASDSSVLEMQPDMPQIGQLELALEYDREVSGLVISIIQARDLAPNQYSGTLDTFIRGVFLADSSDKFQTKVSMIMQLFYWEIQTTTTEVVTA